MVSSIYSFLIHKSRKILEELIFFFQVVVTGCRADLLKVNVRDFLHPRPFLGHEVEKQITEHRQAGKLTLEAETAFRTRCIDFVIRLVSELQQRLPDSVERLALISALCPVNAPRAVNGSIIPLAEVMGRSAECIAKIDVQWKKLNCIQWENITASTLEFWVEVRKYRDALGRNPFEELVDLALECLILPWSNAEIERLLSQMKIVKTPHRNRLSEEMLCSILAIRSGVKREGRCCDSYEFPDEVLREIGKLVNVFPLISPDMH